MRGILDTNRRLEAGQQHQDQQPGHLEGGQNEEKGLGGPSGPARRLEVLSMDVKPLYPSLEMKEVQKILFQIIMKTDIKFADIYSEEAGRYLAVTMTEEEKTEFNFRETLPLRTTEVTRERRGKVGQIPGPKPTMAYLDIHEVKI